MKRLDLKKNLTAETLPSLFGEDSFAAPAGGEAAPQITMPAAPAAQVPQPEKDGKAEAHSAAEEDFARFHRRLKNICEERNLKALVTLCGGNAIRTNFRHVYDVAGADTFITHTSYGQNTGYVPVRGDADEDLTFTLLHVAPDASARKVSVVVTAYKRQDLSYRTAIWAVTGMTLSKMTEAKGYDPDAIVYQDEAYLMSVIRDSRPWAAQWLREKDYKVAEYVRAPWLETLDKAGYAFARRILGGRGYSAADVERLNRLCQNGTRPKTIFKTQKCVYETLKEEVDMSLWDNYRKMTNTGKLTKDTMVQAYDRGFTIKNLEKISYILGRQRDGRPVFTWVGLMNYLGRLDMYEGLDTNVATELLADYLRMCDALGMEPRTDSDSLEREHRVAIRLMNQRRNEILARQMAEAKVRREALTGKLEYGEGVYFIRPITEYDDLLDEARQQHNCVASYANAIAQGRTIVLTMRETAHPDRSLVTVELSPDCRTIRQKYLAYNQPIRNKSISDFLDRWVRRIRAIGDDAVAKAA